jgi:hypothetical protein
MKKQIFLLSVALLFAGAVLPTSSTSCCTTSAASTCGNACTPEHGKTFLQVTPHFQAASPELVSDFNSNLLYNLEKEDKHGAFEVTVFGGQSTKSSQAAAYYLPYGYSTLTFDGSVTSAGNNLRTFARNAAESVAQASATTAPSTGDQALWNIGFSVAGATVTPSKIFVDAASYQFDSNTNQSKILPWNFGITFAALFEPRGASASGSSSGSGLVTSPAFKATISPTLKYSHVGAGLALRYHFSDDKNGWFGLISTAVQNVRSKFCLNETPITAATAITSANFGTANPHGSQTAYPTTYAAAENINTFVYDPNFTATVAPVGSVYTSYVGSGFPNAVDAAAVSNTTSASNVTPPTSVEEAFAQDSWLYGKVSTCNKVTRLADIELSLGYQWMCGDCASTNWYIGVVIPTGNKGGATYIAPAVVGNGQHAGIMTGSCTEVMLSEESDYSTWYRIDACARYLFRNTQKRSFDLLGNEWSRYMMVWEDAAAYTAAIALANTISFVGGAATLVGTGVANRQYTPGINVFTTDFYIKPQFQGRLNQAVYFQGEHFRAELGWNIFARQKDCVQLACDWTQAPAFADPSFIGGVGLNNNRTIYNDAQLMCYNAVDNLSRVFNTGTTTGVVAGATLVTIADNQLLATNYSDFAITQDQISYDSVATAEAIVNTPYLTLGYAFESDYKPQLSVGGSYEFTTSNRALNQWLVWGKFELAF